MEWGKPTRLPEPNTLQHRLSGKQRDTTEKVMEPARHCCEPIKSLRPRWLLLVIGV